MGGRKSAWQTSMSRRIALYLGGLLLFWPLYRFINHKVPKKPKIVEISGNLRNNHFLSKDEFIIFSEHDRLWALSRTCTHLGCRLNFKEKDNVLECPCHQSRFSTTGDVLNGPAKKPLNRYAVDTTETPSSYLVTLQ